MLQDLPELDSIDAIVFDLGEVIIDLDPNAVLNGFIRHTNGISNQDIVNSLINTPTFLDFETGKLGHQEFISAVNSFLGISLEENEFRAIWNSMLLPIKKDRIEMVEKLRKTHKVYFLSNTNSLHQEQFDSMIRNDGKYECLSDMVDHAVYSHQVGMRKPDEIIYRHIVKVTGKSAERILFLDDKEENIREASRIGIKSMIVKEASDLPGKFEKKLS